MPAPTSTMDDRLSWMKSVDTTWSAVTPKMPCNKCITTVNDVLRDCTPRASCSIACSSTQCIDSPSESKDARSAVSHKQLRFGGAIRCLGSEQVISDSKLCTWFESNCAWRILTLGPSRLADITEDLRLQHHFPATAETCKRNKLCNKLCNREWKSSHTCQL